MIIDDQMGKHIIELLKQKTEENVRVYVITDSSSGFLSGIFEGRTAVPYLVERGIPVAEYNPMRANRTGRLPVFVYRDHQKFWLIDGETIVLGGQNIWATSLNSPEESG